MRIGINFALGLLFGLGLVISALVAFVPILLGDAVLDHGAIELHVPLFHEVRVSTTLLFDIGVFLVVVGLIVMATEAFGDDDPQLFALLDERDDPVHGDLPADPSAAAEPAGDAGPSATDLP